MLSNIRINNIDNILTVNKAVGDVDGIVGMKNNNDSAKSYVSESNEELKDCDKVELVNFDHFISSEKILKIDYLKIDVEGYEYNVLKGMKNFLKNTPPLIIQIEIYESFLNRSGSSINQVEEFFLDLGYSFYKLNQSVNKLINIRQIIEGDVFIIKDENIEKLSTFIIS